MNSLEKDLRQFHETIMGYDEHYRFFSSILAHHFPVTDEQMLADPEKHAVRLAERLKEELDRFAAIVVWKDSTTDWRDIEELLK